MWLGIEIEKERNSNVIKVFSSIYDLPWVRNNGYVIFMKFTLAVVDLKPIYIDINSVL